MKKFLLSAMLLITTNCYGENLNTENGLIWSPIEKKLNWEDAANSCSKLNTTKEHSWRMPRKDELIDLYNSKILQRQKNWKLDWTWSSTKLVKNGLVMFNEVYIVGLDDGKVFSQNIGNKRLVSCVLPSKEYAEKNKNESYEVARLLKQGKKYEQTEIKFSSQKLISKKV
jgi:hypothetical protein